MKDDYISCNCLDCPALAEVEKLREWKEHAEAYRQAQEAEVERLQAELEGMDQAALERVQQVSRERDARLEFCPRCNLRLRPARITLAE